MLEVRLDAKASQDYLSAFDYYWGVSPAIAAAFDAAEQSTEAMIGQFPFMGREFEGNYLIRHFAVHGFPYMLIYKIEASGLSSSPSSTAVKTPASCATCWHRISSRL